MEELMAEPVVDALFIRKTEIRTVAAYPIHSVLVFSPYPNLTPHAPSAFLLAALPQPLPVALSYRPVSRLWIVHDPPVLSRSYAAWIWRDVTKRIGNSSKTTQIVLLERHAQRYIFRSGISLSRLYIFTVAIIVDNFLTIDNRYVTLWSIFQNEIVWRYRR